MDDMRFVPKPDIETLPILYTVRYHISNAVLLPALEGFCK